MGLGLSVSYPICSKVPCRPVPCGYYYFPLTVYLLGRDHIKPGKDVSYGLRLGLGGPMAGGIGGLGGSLRFISYFSSRADIHQGKACQW